MGVFEEFEKRKNNGEKLDISTLTRDQLKQMWYHEIRFDRQIADLFDVKVARVKSMRKNMGLMFYDIRAEVITDIMRSPYAHIIKALYALPDWEQEEMIEIIQNINEHRQKRTFK